MAIIKGKEIDLATIDFTSDALFNDDIHVSMFKFNLVGSHNYSSIGKSKNTYKIVRGDKSSQIRQRSRLSNFS